MINHREIYEEKYIQNEASVFGFYSGNKLLNLMGLTTQVPNILEITTNKAKEDKQRIKEGYTLIELKKPPVKITKENADTLPFLEAIAAMLNKTNYKLNDDDAREIFMTFIVNNAITKKNIKNFVSYYPEVVKKELYESRLIDELKSYFERDK